MADLYEDWPDEREGIIDETLGTLRDQRDSAQEQTLAGHQEFSPTTFSVGKSIVVGPIRFETSFNTKPKICFGVEQGAVNRGDVPAISRGRDVAP